MKTMLQVAKPAGFGNVILEEVPIPTPGPREVLVKNQVSLISRGSEILRRYMREEAIDPAIMGYSVAGVVAEVGAEAAARFQPGDRVIASAPHAQYVIQDIDKMEGSQIWPLPAEISFAHGAFLPLSLGGLTWAEITDIRPNDTVVILGQGLVGNLVMQAARLFLMEKLITVDALPIRCRLSSELGADHVINAAEQDPVAAVMELTHGQGADVVIDCVGGRPGINSFAQALDMTKAGATIHLIGLYHNEPLPLDSGKIQRKKLIGGYYRSQPRPVMLPRTIEQVLAGRIRIEPLISHRFHYSQAKEAYDLLYDRLGDAMGVLLDWREEKPA